MNIRNRMLKAIGMEPDNKQSIEEMAIKKIDWNFVDGEATKSEIDMTAREFAKWAIIDRLNTVGYWTESFADEAEKMTAKEKKMVNDHIDKFVSRIYSMLKPKR